MALRLPPAGLDPAQAMPVREERWETYDCELVTPLYGGGVTAGEVDEKMPVRASAIRGQLRFWWRLLARHRRKLVGNELRREEFDLWGGLGKPVQASKLWLRVSEVRGIEMAPWANYTKNWNSTWKGLPDPETWAKAPYALFPAQGRRPGLRDSQSPAELARPGLQWRLEMSFANGCSDIQIAECVEALRWWASFGGIGARSRRGLGAVCVQGLTAVDATEAAAIGCTLVLAGATQTTATPAWIAAIEKLQCFRQAEGIGRNPRTQGRPGRSRWPEADAIRRLTQRHAPQHPPQHPGGQVFPRAAFGLPIIFQFKDEKAGDPAPFALQPENADRLASPVILRPYRRADGKWFSAALLLPHDHAMNMALVMPDKSVAPAARWLDPASPLLRAPLGQDALHAFLEFFSGQAGGR